LPNLIVAKPEIANFSAEVTEAKRLAVSGLATAERIGNETKYKASYHTLVKLAEHRCIDAVVCLL